MSDILFPVNSVNLHLIYIKFLISDLIDLKKEKIIVCVSKLHLYVNVDVVKEYFF